MKKRFKKKVDVSINKFELIAIMLISFLFGIFTLSFVPEFVSGVFFGVFGIFLLCYLISREVYYEEIK